MSKKSSWHQWSIVCIAHPVLHNEQRVIISHKKYCLSRNYAYVVRRFSRNSLRKLVFATNWLPGSMIFIHFSCSHPSPSRCCKLCGTARASSATITHRSYVCAYFITVHMYTYVGMHLADLPTHRNNHVFITALLCAARPLQHVLCLFLHFVCVCVCVAFCRSTGYNCEIVIDQLFWVVSLGSRSRSIVWYLCSFSTVLLLLLLSLLSF